MAREEYRETLDELRSDVRAMGDLALDQLEIGLQALREGDEDLARNVIEGDDELNRTYLELEQDCIDLLALQQPVASDLRFVAASFKILTDVERVGDLATNLGAYAIGTEHDRGPVIEIDVQGIGRDAGDLFEDALDAYEDGDAEACREIAERDDEIDAACTRASERIVRDLVEREPGPWEVERLIDDVSRLLLTIRDLERVADHGVNVAARTRYAVENDPTLVY